MSVVTISQTALISSSTLTLSNTATAQQPYDYKKELECILHEIENKLKRQFEDIFVQMEQKLKKLEKLMTQQVTQNTAQDSKLDNFMQKHTAQKSKQDSFNETVTKQLDYLVVNMPCFLKCATPLPTSQHPSPTHGDGQA